MPTPLQPSIPWSLLSTQTVGLCWAQGRDGAGLVSLGLGAAQRGKEPGGS